MFLVVPLGLAHGTAQEHALEGEEEFDKEFGPLGGGPNDWAKLLPWNYFLEGKWGQGIAVIILWMVTVGGIGKILLFLIARLLE